jgi:hypothetical protein
MAKKILIGIVAVVAIFLGVVAMQPAQLDVARSATFEAPPAVVYAHVSDLKKFGAWSPWEKLDPNMKKTFEGEAGTPGHSMAWAGNDDVGKGKMTITAAEAHKAVKMDLEFIEPFPSKAQTALTLEPAGQGTKLTWAMSSENDFMGKAFGLLMDMEGMIGGDYEKGLAALKPIVEKDATEIAAAAAKIAEAKKKALAEAAAAAAAKAAAAGGGGGAGGAGAGAGQ